MAVPIAQVVQVTCFRQACEVAVPVAQAGDDEVHDVIIQAGKVVAAVTQAATGLPAVVQAVEGLLILHRLIK